MKRENPYRHREGKIDFYRRKIEKHLQRLGAKRIMLGSDIPSVTFTLSGQRYIVDQDPEAFIKAWPRTKPHKAFTYAWALLADYIIGSLTRAEINAENLEDIYRYMSPHLLLRDGVTTVEDEIVRAISRDDVPLLTTGGESE